MYVLRETSDCFTRSCRCTILFWMYFHILLYIKNKYQRYHCIILLCKHIVILSLNVFLNFYTFFNVTEWGCALNETARRMSLKNIVQQADNRGCGTIKAPPCSKVYARSTCLLWPIYMSKNIQKTLLLTKICMRKNKKIMFYFWGMLWYITSNNVWIHCFCVFSLEITVVL